MPFFFVIAYMLAIYVRPNEIVPAWAGLPIVAVLTASVLAVSGFTYFTRPRKFWDLPHDWFVLGMWFAIVVSNLSWGWFGGALLGFSAYLRIVLYYFLLRFSIREPWQLRGLVWTLVAANLFLALAGVVQYHTGVGLGGVRTENGRIQATGIFNDPNDLALTLLMVVPFVLDVVTDKASTLGRRLLASAVLAPIVAAFLYTNSRGGMIAFGVVLVVHFLRRLGWIAAAVGPAVVLVAGFAWGPSRLATLVPWDRSVMDRMYAWGAALRMFKSDPFLGVGYDRFFEFHELVAHNSFLHPLAELGLLGAFCFVGICYWLVRGLLAEPREGSEIGTWRWPLLESTIGVLTSCCFLSRQYWIPFYSLVGMGACYAAIARQYGAEADLRMSPRIAAQIFAIVLAGIAGTYLCVRLFSLIS